MNAETIKSFLVSLGFEVDEAGAQRFNTVLKGVTLGAVKAGLAIEGAALSVVGFTTQIANGLDKVYWASQRTGASVQGIKALGYSVAQMGGNVQAATSSLEGLARFLRSSPGAEGFLNRLGVQTRDASGKMRDTADIFTGVGQKLNSMPVYRAKQYAQMLGIDEDTLLTIRRGLGQVSSEYALTAKRIGLNTEEAAKKSNTFISSLTRLTMTLGQARDKIGSSLAGGLASGIDDLRKQLLDNWPKIEAVLTKVLKGILWAASALTRVLWRTGQAISGVIDWFNKLDPATKQLIELFGGLLIAWRLLNTAFLTSPIGIILSLFTAIGLLWEDYQTWKEGGKSLIDWKKWEPDIEQAKKAILWLRDKLLGLKDVVGGWQNTLKLFATYIAGSWAMKMLSGITKVAKGFGPIIAAMAAIDAWNKVGEAQEEAKKEGVSTGEYLVNRMHKEAAERESSGNTIGDIIIKWLHA
ncbi:MAG: lytic transglycosylase domain-containing protein, partial [Ewingella sp.]|nr:lytic transglycosylase domain-containing protein [Ewingella sp.]